MKRMLAFGHIVRLFQILSVFTLGSAASSVHPRLRVHEWDVDTATLSVKLAYASQCSSEAIRNWNCSWCKGIDAKSVSVVNRRDFSAFAYVATTHVGELGESVVMNLRSTINDENWAEVRYPKPLRYPFIEIIISVNLRL